MKRHSWLNNSGSFAHPSTDSQDDESPDPRGVFPSQESYDATVGAFLRAPPDFVRSDVTHEVPTIIGAVSSPLPPSSVTVVTDEDSYDRHFHGGSSSVINHQMVLRDWNGYNRLTVVGPWASHGGGSGVNYFACAVGVLLEHQITMRMCLVPKQLHDRIEKRDVTHAALERLLDDDRYTRTIWESGDGLTERALKFRCSDLYEWVAGRQSDMLDLAAQGRLTDSLHDRRTIQWGALDPELAELKRYVKGSSPEDDGTAISQFGEGDIDVVINKAARILEDRIRSRLKLSDTSTKMTRVTQERYIPSVHQLLEGFRTLIRNPSTHSVKRYSYSDMRRVLQMTDCLLQLVEDPALEKRQKQR